MEEELTPEEMDDYINKWTAVLGQRESNARVTSLVDMSGGGGGKTTAVVGGSIVGGALKKAKVGRSLLRMLKGNRQGGGAVKRGVYRTLDSATRATLISSAKKVLGLPEGAVKNAARKKMVTKLSDIDKATRNAFATKKYGGTVEHHKKAAFKMAGNTKLNVTPILERLDPKVAQQIVTDPKFAPLFKEGAKLTLKQIDQIGRRYKDSFRPVANEMFDVLQQGKGGVRLKKAATRYNRAVKAARETEKILTDNNIPRMVRGKSQEVPDGLKAAVEKPIADQVSEGIQKGGKALVDTMIVKPVIGSALVGGAGVGATAGLAIGEAVNEASRQKRKDNTAPEGDLELDWSGFQDVETTEPQPTPEIDWNGFKE